MMVSLLTKIDALPTIGTSPNSYHSLVALDTTQNRSTAVFGCTSWVYKAMAEKNGKFCCLRRLEGEIATFLSFRELVLTNDRLYSCQ